MQDDGTTPAGNLAGLGGIDYSTHISTNIPTSEQFPVSDPKDDGKVPDYYIPQNLKDPTSDDGL